MFLAFVFSLGIVFSNTFQYSNLNFDYNEWLLDNHEIQTIQDRIINMVKEYKFNYQKYDAEIQRLLEIKDWYKEYYSFDLNPSMIHKVDIEINRAKYIIMNIIALQKELKNFEDWDFSKAEHDDLDWQIDLEPKEDDEKKSVSWTYDGWFEDWFRDWVNDKQNWNEEWYSYSIDDNKSQEYEKWYDDWYTKGWDYLDWYKDWFNDGEYDKQRWNEKWASYYIPENKPKEYEDWYDRWYNDWFDWQDIWLIDWEWDDGDWQEWDNGDWQEWDDEDWQEWDDGDWEEDWFNSDKTIQIPGNEWHYVYIKNEIQDLSVPAVVEVLSWDNQTQSFIDSVDWSSNIYRIENNSDDTRTVEFQLKDNTKQSPYQEWRNIRWFESWTVLKEYICSDYKEVSKRNLNYDYSWWVDGTTITEQISWGYTVANQEWFWIYCE